MPFYPNDCFICHSIGSLKRCSRCNMISYCGEPHQKQHWKYHKDICKIISNLMIESGVSHLYENLRDAKPITWKAKREEIRKDVESRMSRPFVIEEVEMFRFPRACFVCHEARQDLLRNCSGCSLASFCKDHPSSPIHDKDCATIKKSHDFELILQGHSSLITKVLSQMVAHIPYANGSSKQPTTTEELISGCLSNHKLPEAVGVNASEHFSIPLSIFNAFKKLEIKNSNSNMVIHVRGIGKRFIFTNTWESLLHLVPGLNILTVIATDQNENAKMEATLCSLCSSKKKKLIIEGHGIHYLEFLRDGNHKKPNVVAVFNVAPSEGEDREREVVWKVEIGAWNQLNCPLVLTTTSEKKSRLTNESLCSTFWSSRICYEGSNDFAPLFPTRNWEDMGVCKNNQFLIVIKAPEPGAKGPKRGAFSFAKAMRDFHEPIKKSSKLFFSASICHVCQSTNISVTCKRCKMIFYCGENHQKEDLPQHKDLCKVILAMVIEDRTTNIFEKSKTGDSESWLEAKLDLIKKVKLKVGRELEDYERQMFLFPRTCFICHETDLSILRNCEECGIIFCKVHKDNSKHKGLCIDYSLAIKMKKIEKTLTATALVKPEFFNRTSDTLSLSMESFINSYLTIANTFLSSNFCNIQKILISDALSMPLSLLYGLYKLNFFSKKKLKVHILGTIHREVVEEGFWILLNWLRSLKKLELSFFDSRVSKLPLNYKTDLVFPDISFFGEKGFEVSAHGIRYEDYFRLSSIDKPHIVVGYNLNIHEIDYGIVESNWKDIILTLKRINVPFIMTSGSEERARKDHNKLCSFLGETVEYAFSEENPYSSLFPERDFESEGLRYSNKYITIYTDFNKSVINKSPGLAIAQMGKKVADFELTVVLSSTLEVTLNSPKSKLDKSPNKKVESKSLTVENSNFKEELKTENRDVKTEIVRVENTKNEIETGTGTEKKKFETENCADSDSILTNINKLMKENLRLKDENERIRKENMKLQENSEKLAAENQLIKNFRQQVHESIQLAINEKK